MKFSIGQLNTSLLLILFLTVSLANPYLGASIFQYELWMQAQTSLDMGLIEVEGRMVNTGSTPLELPPQQGALDDLPLNLFSTVGCQF